MKKPRGTPFQPGHPRLGGRTKGSRNTLCADFIADLVDEWRDHGVEIIRIVRAEEPATLLKVIAQLCPKEFEINPNALADLTDEQLGIIAGLLRNRCSNTIAPIPSRRHSMPPAPTPASGC
jgi:hypothetical protein